MVGRVHELIIPLRSRVCCWALLPALLSLAGCSRKKIDLPGNDAPSGIAVAKGTPDPEMLPIIPDAGLEADAGTCAGRPQGACVGTNDFVCDFEGWLPTIAKECQQRTGCNAENWLAVTLTGGCATTLRMESPSDGFAACLAEILSTYRCPCQGELSAVYHLSSSRGQCADAADSVLR